MTAAAKQRTNGSAVTAPNPTVEQLTWYVAELQHVVKALVTQLTMQQVQPALDAQRANQEAAMRAELTDQLARHGFASLVPPSS